MPKAPDVHVTRGQAAGFPWVITLQWPRGGRGGSDPMRPGHRPRGHYMASAGERPAGRDGLMGISLWLRRLPLPLGFGAALRCCDWGEGEGLPTACDPPEHVSLTPAPDCQS